MQEIMKFEDNDVEIIQDENGEPLFEIYSIIFYKNSWQMYVHMLL